MDFKAAGVTEEVQKEQENMPDWTSKLWGSRQRSKAAEKVAWIGRWGSGSHGGSPKGARKHARLDVKAAGKQVEVQNGRESGADWTLT